MADASNFAALNSVEYLYLRKLSEPRDNSLSVVVEEAIANRARPVAMGPTAPRELIELARGGSPIESTETCRTFELSWRRYIAYLVTEESVGSCGKYDDETYTGRFFREYTR